MQLGDVPETWADTHLLAALTGRVPSTPVEEGIDRFVKWFRNYYGK
jgi:UDP-glucuronate 4-epimerase